MAIILNTIMRFFCFFKKENDTNENTPLIQSIPSPPSISNPLLKKNKRECKECSECKKEIRIEDTIYFGMDRKFCSKECRRDFIINIV